MRSVRRQSGERPTPPPWVSTYWWEIAGLGLLLLTVGIVIHASPTERGGPVSLGVVLIIGGLAGLRNKYRQK
jgi:hypothetical protein